MAVDIKFLAPKGVSSGEYRKLFTLEPANRPKRLQKLIDLISARMKDGRTLNLTEWRAYAAIDLAQEIPFSQTTPTLIGNILSQKLDMQGTKDALKNWGLCDSDLYLKVPKPDGVGTMEVLNPPVFFQIFIPIVKAYSAAVLAKLYNERNTDPLLPFKPLKETTQNEIACEIITDMVNTQATWYGYPAVVRQAIQQMLKYGIMLAFPQEEWHCEKQIRDDGSERGEKIIVKEGLRYQIPHPTRMFFDLNHPLTSINTDTGCEWAGHWRVMRYSDILDNPMYWNRKRIFCGTNWFGSALAGNYFSEIFPCSLEWPTRWGSNFTATREDKMAWYNTANDRDKAVFVTEYFQKLVPAEWGLGNYKYPVWHRFTMASDDTVIWCAPCAYTPAWFMGYDYDENAGRNSSLALELIPWQDHLGNILSQMLLTAKQNLANFTFYDTNVVNEADVRGLLNKGDQFYRGLHFVGYDSLKRQRAGVPSGNEMHTVQLQKQSINDLQVVFQASLNTMERVLQIAAQETGAAASHQQSKAEIEQTGGATSSRRRFTASYVDEGLDAMGRQLYTADMAYFNPEVLAQVTADIPDLDTHLEALGFKIEHRGEKNVLVKGHKKALRLEGFAARIAGADPTREKELATIIFQVVSVVSGQPELFKKVGAKNLLTLIELAAKKADGTLALKMMLEQPGKDDEVDPKVIELLQQVQKQIMEAVAEKVAQPAAKEVAQVQQEITQLQQTIKQMEPIFKIAAQQQDATVIKQKEAEAKIQIEQAKFQADEKRKDMALQGELARKAKESEAKVGMAAAAVQLKHETAHHSAVLAAATPEPTPAAETPEPVKESVNYTSAPEEIREQLEIKDGLTPPAKRTYPKKEAKAGTPPKSGK